MKTILVDDLLKKAQETSIYFLVKSMVAGLPIIETVDKHSFDLVAKKYAKIQNKLIKGDYVEITRCCNCVHGIPMKEFSSKDAPPYKYFRSDTYICTCEDLIGDEPVVVTKDFYCGYGYPQGCKTPKYRGEK